LRFVTNTTSRSAPDIAEALRHAGVELDDDELVTAGVATADLLARDHPDAPCLVLNDGSMDDLAGLHLVEPGAPDRVEVVVVGSGGPGFGWATLNVAVRALLDGAALVAMHGSMLWNTVDGACLDCGAYARMLAVASGVEPTVVGKPSPEMFHGACASMGVEPGGAVMVGDDVHSDVLASQRAGLTGVLVRTGKFRPAVLGGLDEEPDGLIDSLAALPAWLARR